MGWIVHLTDEDIYLYNSQFQNSKRGIRNHPRSTACRTRKLLHIPQFHPPNWRKMASFGETEPYSPRCLLRFQKRYNITVVESTCLRRTDSTERIQSPKGGEEMEEGRRGRHLKISSLWDICICFLLTLGKILSVLHCLTSAQPRLCYLKWIFAVHYSRFSELCHTSH